MGGPVGTGRGKKPPGAAPGTRRPWGSFGIGICGMLRIGGAGIAPWAAVAAATGFGTRGGIYFPLPVLISPPIEAVQIA